MHKINLYFDTYSFVHMEVIEEDQCLSFIMREINLLTQLYQRYVISQESCTLSAPSENYFHTVSYRIFLFISDYFAGLTCHISPLQECCFCMQYHDCRHFCSTCDFSSEPMEILLDSLEYRPYVCFMPNDYTRQLINLCVHLMPNDHSFIAVISFQENLRQHDQLPDTVVTAGYVQTDPCEMDYQLSGNS